jgi:hypothetical protein
MNARIKALLGLLLLFTAGIGTGIFMAPHLKPAPTAKPFPAAEWIDATLSEYRASLALDADEEKLVHTTLTTAAQSIVRERSEAQQRLQAVVKTMNGDLMKKLDSDSQQRLEKLLEQKRAKRGAAP